MSTKDGWRGRFFEDFAVGDVFQHPLGRTVTEADEVWFCNLMTSPNQLHFNKDYASRTQFGRAAVNAPFTNALVTGLSVSDISQNGINVEWTEIKVPNPLFVGETVYADSEVLEVTFTRRSDGSEPLGAYDSSAPPVIITGIAKPQDTDDRLGIFIDKPIKVRISDGDGFETTMDVLMSEGYEYSFEADPGTYTITATCPGYLSFTYTNVVINEDTVLPDITLMAGALLGRSAISVLDIGYLIKFYNVTGIKPEDEASVADLNGDGAVDFNDIIIIVRNVGKIAGEINKQ